jgi:TIGR03009 family protein
MRRLTRSKCAALFVCGLAAAPSPLAAQSGRARVQTETPPPQGAAPREARPQAQPLRVDPADIQLDALLKDWHQKTADIKRLQGEHRRWTYDKTFSVAKIAEGKFFYEGPDKGRIDLSPVPPDPKNPTTKDDAGNVYPLKADKPERWVCDGERVVRVDDDAKTYEVQPIPPQHQGANIMDGPLPFLFGLPPEKAKQRYDMTLVKQDEKMAFLIVTPLQQQDAANWQRADVMLDKKTYLPKAVKLIDPAGTRVTVYSFGDIEINPTSILKIFTGDPFKPVLLGYKQVQAPQAAGVQPLNLKGNAKGLPTVVGLAHTEATRVLVARGYDPKAIKVQRGPLTKNPKLRWCVADQSPPADADVKPGQQIVLTLYVSEEDLKKDAQK